MPAVMLMMLMMLTLSFTASPASAVRYRAAVVEFSPTLATTADLATWTKPEAWQHSLANVDRFAPFLDEAARNGSQVRSRDVNRYLS